MRRSLPARCAGPSLIAAALVAFAVAPPASGRESPAFATAALDSLARAAITAADGYRSVLGAGSPARAGGSPLASAPYPECLKRVDSLIDTVLTLARDVTRKAEPLKVPLAEKPPGGRRADPPDLTALQGEVYDAAMRLKRPLGYFRIGESLASGATLDYCPEIDTGLPAVAPLMTFAAAANSIRDSLWNRTDFSKVYAEIREDEEILRRFRLKLIDGFPAYPWEYLFNLSGDRRRPARGQFIYLHPTFGFAYDGPWSELPANTLHLQGWLPAIHLEAFGFNYYFFNRGFNYLGVSAVAWAAIGDDEGGYGFDVHLANWITLGAGLWDGDGDWDPRLMVGWTTVTEKLLGVFKQD